MNPALRAVPLLASLPDEDLERLSVHDVHLDPGEQLFAEGDAAEGLFVICGGELEVWKRDRNRDVLLAVRRPGEVIGEMGVLSGEVRSATIRARSATDLLAITRADFEELLAGSAAAVRSVFENLLERWRGTRSRLMQSERMAQLGTFTAGLAHEINNPAAAVARSSSRVSEAVHDLAAAERQAAGLPDDLIAWADGLQPDQQLAGLSALERSRLEDEVDDRLTEGGVESAWEVAPVLVEAGLAGCIDEMLERGGAHLGVLVNLLRWRAEVDLLLTEMTEGARRLSELVGAMKTFTYLDRGEVQTVDLKTSIESTLLVMKGKLGGVEVRRSYADDLPKIEGHGGALNQVWANLIDNAAYAVSEADRSDGRIEIRAYRGENGVVVEVEDNGTGISPEDLQRVFDAFFTTKPPGSGTGLGLGMVYGIVVDEHGGDLDVKSEPGRTVFTVRLPMRPPGLS
jgi:signal transduction histidine kinase